MGKQQGIRPCQYGQVYGPIVSVSFPIAASINFEPLSGKFVVIDSNNRVALATATSTNIIGWALAGDWTSNATAGTDTVVVNLAKDAVYELPLDAARTEAQLKALVGETCDIIVTSDIMYADYDASAIDVLEIMDYRYYGSAAGEQTLLCRMYLPNITTKGGVV